MNNFELFIASVQIAIMSYTKNIDFVAYPYAYFRIIHILTEK